METQLFPKGEQAPADYFVGMAWVKSLVPADAIWNTSIAHVSFEPGSRNNWHQHSGGQILIVTSGTCFFQEKGKPKQIYKAGEVIKIAPGVMHWHGASADAAMTHLAVNTNTQKGLVDWMEKVTDEEYDS